MVDLQELMFFKALTHKVEGEETLGDMKKEIFDPTSEIENAGGIPAFVKAVLGQAFVITLTEDTAITTPITYTADKTYAQVKAAYDAGKVLIANVSGTSLLPLMGAQVSNVSMSLTFGYTEIMLDGTIVFTREINYFHNDIQDIWKDDDSQIEPLLLDGGTMLGDIDMGSNSIMNIHNLHVEGDTPILLGDIIEAAGATGVRLGCVDGDIAVLSAGGTSYLPIVVGTPTKDHHAVTKQLLETSLENKLNKITTTKGQLKVYCANGDKQDQCIVSNAGVANSIARYDASGRLISSAAPSVDNHLANKAYVDEAITNNNSTAGDYSVGGDLSVAGRAYVLGEPINDVDVVNKGYLKGRFNYDSTTKTLNIIM